MTTEPHYNSFEQDRLISLLNKNYNCNSILGLYSLNWRSLNKSPACFMTGNISVENKSYLAC